MTESELLELVAAYFEIEQRLYSDQYFDEKDKRRMRSNMLQLKERIRQELALLDIQAVKV